jgi:hypothetical protein
MSYLIPDAAPVSAWIQPQRRDSAADSKSRFARKAASSSSSSSSTSVASNATAGTAAAEAKDSKDVAGPANSAATARERELASARANARGPASSRIVRQCGQCQVLYTSFHACNGAVAVAAARK